MWETCAKCTKPLVSESNLWKIRAIMSGSMVGSDGIDTATLSLLGFGSNELINGSTAAAIYSNISNIIASSVFATLHSLEVNAQNTVLFGCESSALDLLRALAAKMDWCCNECENNNDSVLEFETIDGSCDKGCMARFRLTVTNVGNLLSVRSPQFKLGHIIWNLIVFKNSPYLGVYLHGNKSCQIKMKVCLVSRNNRIGTIEQLQTKHIEAHGGLCVNDLILWNELLKPENQFVQNNSISIEVEVKGETCTKTALDPVKLECKICLENIDFRDSSSIPCGHLFCSMCIRQSLSECEICPQCETPATLSDLRRTILPIVG